MALWRMPADYLFGTLSQAAAIGDTSISSASFAGLATSYTTSAVLPIVLHNPATGVREMVWVTAHTAAATSVTVVRGKEGTSAQAWPSGTQWIVAPTAARDGLPAMSTAALNALTDQHVGMRALNTDTSTVWEWTYGAGWQPEIGVCKPTDVNPGRSGSSPPNNASMTLRCGYLSGTTNGSGDISATFTSPFPTGCQTAIACVADATIWFGIVSVSAESATGLTLHCADTSPLAAHASGAVRLYYMAIGY
jgi:hypothetical protein